ncbi:MAG: hypothetical protein ABWJ99_02610 [Caldimicrobium sp.]
MLSLMLALVVAGVIGVTAGCKKKEEAPAPTEQPKAEQPAQPAQPEQPTANQTGGEQPAQQQPAEQPAKKQ